MEYTEMSIESLLNSTETELSNERMREKIITDGDINSLSLETAYAYNDYKNACLLKDLIDYNESMRNKMIRRIADIYKDRKSVESRIMSLSTEENKDGEGGESQEQDKKKAESETNWFISIMKAIGRFFVTIFEWIATKVKALFGKISNSLKDNETSNASNQEIKDALDEKLNSEEFISLLGNQTNLYTLHTFNESILEKNINFLTNAVKAYSEMAYNLGMERKRDWEIESFYKKYEPNINVFLKHFGDLPGAKLEADQYLKSNNPLKILVDSFYTRGEKLKVQKYVDSATDETNFGNVVEYFTGCKVLKDKIVKAVDIFGPNLEYKNIRALTEKIRKALNNSTEKLKSDSKTIDSATSKLSNGFNQVVDAFINKDRAKYSNILKMIADVLIAYEKIITKVLNEIMKGFKLSMDAYRSANLIKHKGEGDINDIKYEESENPFRLAPGHKRN